MDLDVPRPRALREAIEEIAAEGEDRREAFARPDRIFDRLEPARHSAVQRVVVDRLEVRLMRRTRHRAAGLDGEGGVTPAAIASAVGHVRVELEMVPAAGELAPVADAAEGREQIVHRLTLHEREP